MFKSVLTFRFVQQVVCVLIVAFAITTLSSPQNKACAQNLESNVCDENIWNTITARAWMEAQREVEISQSIITRPDSVLELSCFDSFADHASKSVGAIFSASESSGGLTQTQVGIAATSAVGQYLAGAGYSDNPLGGGTMAGFNYNPAPGQSFNAQCKKQAEVWINFKCKNMLDLRGVVFDAMKDNDPRTYYVGNSANSCADAGSVGGGNTLFDHKDVWTDALQRLNTPVVAGAIPTYFDVVETFSAMTAPTGACSAAIPTGVFIVLTDGSTTPEMVCPNPGCSYNNGNCVR